MRKLWILVPISVLAVSVVIANSGLIMESAGREACLAQLDKSSTALEAEGAADRELKESDRLLESAWKICLKRNDEANHAVEQASQVVAQARVAFDRCAAAKRGAYCPDTRLETGTGVLTVAAGSTLKLESGGGGGGGDGEMVCGPQETRMLDGGWKTVRAPCPCWPVENGCDGGAL